MSSTRKGVGKAMAAMKKKAAATASTMAGIKKYSNMGVPGVGKNSANPVIRSSYQSVVPKKSVVKRIKRGRGAGTR